MRTTAIRYPLVSVRPLEMNSFGSGGCLVIARLTCIVEIYLASTSPPSLAPIPTPSLWPSLFLFLSVVVSVYRSLPLSLSFYVRACMCARACVLESVCECMRGYVRVCVCGGGLYSLAVTVVRSFLFFFSSICLVR